MRRSIVQNYNNLLLLYWCATNIFQQFFGKQKIKALCVVFTNFVISLYKYV